MKTSQPHDLRPTVPVPPSAEWRDWLVGASWGGHREARAVLRYVKGQASTLSPVARLWLRDLTAETLHGRPTLRSQWAREALAAVESRGVAS